MPCPLIQRLPLRSLAIQFHGNRIALFVRWLVIIAIKQAAAPLPLWHPSTHLRGTLLWPLPPSPNSSSNPQWSHSVSAVRLPQHPLSIPIASVSSSLIYCWAESLLWIDLQLVFMSTCSQLSVGKKIITCSLCHVLFLNNLAALKRIICIPHAQSEGCDLSVFTSFPIRHDAE